MAVGERAEPIEVEVERLPRREEGAADGQRDGDARRAARARLDPLTAGIAIDVLDLATRGPRGVLWGLALGLPLGYYLGRRTGLDRARSLGLAGLCGLYCGLPGTGMIPIGTLVGLYRKLVR